MIGVLNSEWLIRFLLFTKEGESYERKISLLGLYYSGLSFLLE